MHNACTHTLSILYSTMYIAHSEQLPGQPITNENTSFVFEFGILTLISSALNFRMYRRQCCSRDLKVQDRDQGIRGGGGDRNRVQHLPRPRLLRGRGGGGETETEAETAAAISTRSVPRPTTLTEGSRRSNEGTLYVHNYVRVCTCTWRKTRYYMHCTCRCA